MLFKWLCILLFALSLRFAWLLSFVGCNSSPIHPRVFRLPFPLKTRESNSRLLRLFMAVGAYAPVCMCLVACKNFSIRFKLLLFTIAPNAVASGCVFCQDLIAPLQETLCLQNGINRITERTLNRMLHSKLCEKALSSNIECNKWIHTFFFVFKINSL